MADPRRAPPRAGDLVRRLAIGLALAVALPVVGGAAPAAPLPPPAPPASPPAPPLPPSPAPPPLPPLAAPLPGDPCRNDEAPEEVPAPRRELHVAVGGDDASGDGSRERPYRTLSRALAEAAPGTAFRLHPGDHAGGIHVADLHGEPGAPIRIGGLPGAEPARIVGGTVGIHLVRPRHVVVHDLLLDGARAVGLNADDGGDVADDAAAHDLELGSLEVRDVGTGGNHDGIKLSGVRRFLVRDCVVRRVSAGSGIDLVGCHDGGIVRCTFAGMGSNAVQAKGGSARITIARCDFEDAGQRGVNVGGSTGFSFFRPPLSRTAPNAEARDVRLVANVFGECQTPFAFVGAVGCVVAHNTMRGRAYRWLFRVLQETTSRDGYEFLPTQDCRVSGNVFEFSAAALAAHVNVGPGTRGDTYAIERNLWFAADAPARSRPASLPAPEADGVYGRDPFPDAALAPRIAARSPAAGGGRRPPPIPCDHDGAPWSDRPALGAFEP